MFLLTKPNRATSSNEVQWFTPASCRTRCCKSSGW